MRILKLKFYKQLATPKRINKSQFLQELGEIDNVIIKETTNTLEPDFILATNPMVYNANYIWCDFTNRYYFIKDHDLMTGGRVVVHTHSDVLFSFASEILSSSSWVDVADSTSDTSDDYNMLHNDFPFRQDYVIKGKSSTDSIFNTSGINTILILK